MKILIAGAGIGGLTTALACLHAGLDVEIFEKAPKLSEVGAGIQISPNAMRVFQKLGLGNTVIEKGFLPKKLETRMGRSGRRLFAIDAQSWGAPYVHIHRADLIEILKDALPNGILHLSRPAASYSPYSDRVDLIFENGEIIVGDFLIAADGIHSIIREQLMGASQPRFTGNLAWRATVPTRRLGDLVPDPNATVWMGDKSHVVTYRLRGGTLTNFVGIVERDDWHEESWTERGSVSELKADFTGWHPVIDNLINLISARDLFKWALFDRVPLSGWTHGRVTFVGDAVHPMLPFMAQGAAMAIEDGWILARCLAENNLGRYDELRLRRTSNMQAQSRANMKTFHRGGGIKKLAYFPMWVVGHLAPGLIKQRFDLIYGHDVTQYHQ